ncbi:hypothetical protein AB833_28635 [Chromatiales bacterium (ex Bugula neritina AB1)]|nr:hypothetical protein AB833_28635 [Chromatiales bacterium (ex Bugula neritina AB1)]
MDRTDDRQPHRGATVDNGRMIHFHPDTQTLIEYTAGSLPESQALCIATHLEFCVSCKDECHSMLKIGSHLFAASEEPHLVDLVTERSATRQQAIDQRVIDNVLLHIDNPPAPHSAHTADGADLPPTTDHALFPTGFPQSIRKLMPDGVPGLKWKNLGPRIRVAKLLRLEASREIALHQLLAGGVVSNHDHSGREITVVLSGSFSDHYGQYHPGDFLVKEPGQTHCPTASEDRPCVCLSVCDAPVKFTGFFTRLLNPLVALQHRL